MNEQREVKDIQIDYETQKARSLIKLIMIALDYFYPSSELYEVNDKAFREKQYFRSKVMDCINNILRYIKEKEDEIKE